MNKKNYQVRELEVILQRNDCTDAGSFRKNSHAHIGRITREGGDVVAIACGEKPDIRYRYSFNLHIVACIPMCQTCIDKIQGKIDGIEWDEVGHPFTPASNTGVN